MIYAKDIKICLVSDCLSSGGAERVAAILSIFFVKQGIDIHHVIVQDKVDYTYSGKLLNLGKFKNNSNSVFNKFHRLTIFRKYLQQNNFDYIIDFRIQNHFLQELFISKFLYKKNAIYCISSYMINLYLPQNKWLARKIHSKNHKLIGITDAINQKVEQDYGFKNLKKILNPIDTIQIEKLAVEDININFDYIIAAGRMDYNKQFDQLINYYAKSKLPENNIKLLLLGDGICRQSLELQAKNLNLGDKVVFLGQVKNPYAYFAKAKFLVLCSVHEGLPMVLLESLACGTPVVSFDCLTGPIEIIIHEQNGLLVENQNFAQLTKSMNLFIENKELYELCKINAKKSIKHFSIENIGKQWLEFLNISTN